MDTMKHTFKCGLIMSAILFLATGCSNQSTSPSDPGKKITWEQYRKMSIEDQGDPYVINNLDEAALKKFNAAGKKTGK